MSKAYKKGEVFDGRFELIEELGSGPFSRVFRAVQLNLDRDVVIKFLTAQDSESKARARFRREARLLSQLNHPNTLTLYDFGWNATEQPFLVTEYVPGQTLWRLLKNEGSLGPERAIGIMRQVLLGLREAHAKGIIHRDLKPNNIMVFDTVHERDRVKVLDFGIAKFVDAMVHDEKEGDLTVQGKMVGTPRYMAPELLAGGEASPASDLYALGLILFEMLTGRRAIVGKIMAQIIARQLSPDPILSEEDRSVPEALRAVILASTSKDPGARVPSCSDFLTLLDGLGSPSALDQGAEPQRGPYLPVNSLAFLEDSEASNGVLDDEGWPTLDPGSVFQPIDFSQDPPDRPREAHGDDPPEERPLVIVSPDLPIEIQGPPPLPSALVRSGEGGGDDLHLVTLDPVEIDCVEEPEGDLAPAALQDVSAVGEEPEGESPPAALQDVSAVGVELQGESEGWFEDQASAPMDPIEAPAALFEAPEETKPWGRRWFQVAAVAAVVLIGVSAVAMFWEPVAKQEEVGRSPSIPDKEAAGGLAEGSARPQQEPGRIDPPTIPALPIEVDPKPMDEGLKEAASADTVVEAQGAPESEGVVQGRQRKITIQTAPTWAYLTRDGKIQGRTPMEIVLDEKEPSRWVLTRAGFVPVQLSPKDLEQEELQVRIKPRVKASQDKSGKGATPPTEQKGAKEDPPRFFTF